MRTCPCGREFQQKSGKQRFCSAFCKAKAGEAKRRGAGSGFRSRRVCARSAEQCSLRAQGISGTARRRAGSRGRSFALLANQAGRPMASEYTTSRFGSRACPKRGALSYRGRGRPARRPNAPLPTVQALALAAAGLTGTQTERTIVSTISPDGQFPGSTAGCLVEGRRPRDPLAAGGYPWPSMTGDSRRCV
jgi:hypothetical protein